MKISDDRPVTSWNSWMMLTFTGKVPDDWGWSAIVGDHVGKIEMNSIFPMRSGLIGSKP